jgi:hypothetical protein
LIISRTRGLIDVNNPISASDLPSLNNAQITHPVSMESTVEAVLAV